MAPTALSDLVHDQIPYTTPEDKIIFGLSDTPEFQRLARICQMGLARMVYPGAKHCRDEHSRGVEYNIRNIIDRVIKPQLGSGFDPERALSVRIAGLLHDLGHGPGSHAFEDAMALIGRRKSHEEWTLQLILENTAINRLLRQIDSKLPDTVAKLFEECEHKDIFSSLVSGQMDCDRLDFVLRDALHTRVSSSFTTRERERLFNALSIESIDLPGEDGEMVTTDVLAIMPQGLSAAEGFMRAYRDLYSKVSFHKLKRGAEAVQSALLKHIALLIRDEAPLARIGLPMDNPIIRYMHNENSTVGDYLRMDDSCLVALWDAAKYSSDTLLRDLGARLLERRLYVGREVDEMFGNGQSRARQLFKENLPLIAEACDLIPGITLIVDEPNKKGYREYPLNRLAATQNIFVCRHYEQGEGEDSRAIVPLSRASSDVAALKFPDHIRIYAPDEEKLEQVLQVIPGLIPECANKN